MVAVLIFIGVALWLAYAGWGRYYWSGWVGAGVLYYTLFAAPGWLGLLLSWLVLSGLLLVLHATQLRRRYLIAPIMAKARAVLPEISATEREAIDAGTVSWDGELFSGKPNWQQLHDLKKPELSTAEQAFIEGPVEQLCNMLDDWQISHQDYDLKPETWQFMKDHGFFGMIIPAQYGGLEMSALAHSCVVMKLSSRSISAAVTVMVPNSLGPAELLMMYGTQAQRDYYLPRLARGEEIPCFALTGPTAGSDAGAIADSGVVCRGEWQGEEVLGLRLNWHKRYITLAPVATLLGLAFKVYDPDRLLGGDIELGVTCALIPANTAGITMGDRHLPLSSVFMNGPTWGHDVFVPMDCIIGGQDNIGKGWAMLMNCLAVGRSISLPALSVGAGKLCCLTTGAYSRIREQFNTPIGYFEGVEEVLAKIGGLTYLMDSARTLTTSLVDNGEKPAVPSAILKFHNTEAMRTVVNHAMDIHAGRGIINGPRNYIAALYQAIPISITVEGANILTRSMMIFGQGAIRCHPYLLQEMEALRQDDSGQGLRAFDELLGRHFGHQLQMTARSLVMGLSHARLATAPRSCGRTARRYYRHLNRMAAGFFLISDVALLILGGELKRREKISGRLADGLSYLYLGSAVLKRFQDDGNPDDDRPLLDWAMQYCLYQLQTALLAALDNFPSPALGRVLKGLVFPLGRRYKLPADALERQVSRLLLTPSAARDRLVAGGYRNIHPDDAIGRIEHAFLKKTANQALDEKLRQAIHSGRIDDSVDLDDVLKQAMALQILSAPEAVLIKAAEDAVADAIQVDHFAAADFPIIAAE